jgi:ABC-type polysaccharide/polyol phosphate transport system ATPase subunit
VSTDLAIRASGLSKVFKIYAHPGDVLWELLSRQTRHVEKAALQDVSFELRRGEVVGILGRNGAGKSTLLKLIAGTLERTSGELDVTGRITAILELGTGFHPDYTGRENIYMGGLCLGMSREEIDRKVESIIAFSELAEVIDQPFRTYSTGMQARLTFSTAISVDPDILIVDEALSVGDAKFQMKCFGRITELRRQRKTILLVSHDLNTITTFCDHAIVLEHGRVYAAGRAREVASAYQQLLWGTGNPLVEAAAAALPAEPVAATEGTDNATAGATAADIELPRASNRYGDGSMAIEWYALLDDAGRPVRGLASGQACTVAFRMRALRDLDDISTGFAIKDRRGTVLFGVTNISQNQAPAVLKAGELLEMRVDLHMWLASGDYFVNLGAGHLHSQVMCDFIEDALQFNVLGPGGIFTTAVVNLEPRFSLRLMPPETTVS